MVGESGCGKTTIGRIILRLLQATQGEVLFEGRDILRMKERQLRNIRRSVQIIFQDPFGSLDPRMSVGNILAEGLVIHRLAHGQSMTRRVEELLDMVQLSPLDARKYPHEFSSGQRQRIGIARALSVNPKFLVADEPVSALDVSIQAQVLNLLMDIQEELKVAYLFITHDLSVVRHISHRVAVMYLGRIVEMADTSVLFSSPLHPYTQALLSAVPHPTPSAKRMSVPIKGETQRVTQPPSGCSFYPRCQYGTQACREEIPKLKVAGKKHLVRCFRVSSESFKKPLSYRDSENGYGVDKNR